MQAGVFRASRSTPPPRISGPRAGGGVPPHTHRHRTQRTWSPRRRGCSGRYRRAPNPEAVVPAQAGVFRTATAPRAPTSRGPRAGGGVPAWRVDLLNEVGWSPRRRGCSDEAAAHRQDPDVVPAQAGVFRAQGQPETPHSRGPRAGGGVPRENRSTMVRPLWSPRRRGCSASHHAQPGVAGVVPAQAGVFRSRPVRTAGREGGPRAGGGVPLTWEGASALVLWSPRRRGCSVFNQMNDFYDAVVPAQAGVFRACAPSRPRACRGPRAGGGVPLSTAASACGSSWSPRRRGCSAGDAEHEQAGSVVPAQAGVFRCRLHRADDTSGGPRAGGGVPP